MNQRLIIALIATLGIIGAVLLEVHVVQAIAASPAMDTMESTETMESEYAYWSLIREDIWTRDQYVEDFNLSLEDCLETLWAKDGYNDGQSWSCERQPDMPGQPGGYIPNGEWHTPV